MLGSVLGIPLLAIGFALSIPARTRWFAAPVVFFAVLGAAIVTVIDSHMPYPRSAVFWGVFTGVAIFLGSASVATAIIGVMARDKGGKHAA